MIAVSFALPAESSGFLARLSDKQSDGQIIRGKIDNKSVTVVHTGVGPAISRIKIGTYLSTERPRLLISAGFAGAVRHDFQVRDLILAENFSDGRLLHEAQRELSGRGACTAKLFTSANVIDSMSKRTELAHEHDAAAVDMETEIIAQACAARTIPMLSLRVISDSLREPFPAPPTVLFDIERQRTNLTRLSRYVIKHPTTAFGLWRFARQIASARQTLTDALVDLVSIL